jgi:predicted HTH transcriptional regulator
MTQVLIFIFGAVVGGIAVWAMIKKQKTLGGESELIEKQAEEKKRNKEAILLLLETQSSLTNNHVEQLLGISDATAERYMQELEHEGKVRQVGKTGQSVYYEKM